MDKASRTRLKKELREQWRSAELRAFPLPIPALEAMFDMLSFEFPTKDCDHSRRLTRAWLVRRGHDVESVFAWLDEREGFCDCKVLLKVEPHFEDAKTGSLTAPN